MPSAAAVRAVLREPNFRRLYATRLISQAADGVFQAAVASAVFFNPERATNARDTAAGFAVLLLPYSLVGPFAGVLLDRWRRQRVLVHANLVRTTLVVLVAGLALGPGPNTVPFYLAALAAVGVNRFYLTALSAALPHVVRPGLLVVANSLSTTSGFLATLAGGLLGLGVRAVAGAGDRGGAVIAGCAAAGYLLAASAAAGFSDPDLLGPDERRPRAAVWRGVPEVLRELGAGLAHLAERRPAAYALLAVTAHRFCYGLSTIATLLLYRNYFVDRGVFRAGLPGLGQVLVASGLGVLAAAVLTPMVTRRIGKPRWITFALLLAAGVELGLGLPFTQPAILAAGLLLGFAAQALRVCVDTILQEVVADRARGRVFAVYDTAYNLAFVAAAVAGAAVLPASGRSPAVLVAIAIGYAGTAAAYALSSRAPVPEPRPVAR